MLQRKSLIVFTLVFAFVALFAAGEGMAFNDEPCYGWNYADTSCGEPPPMPTCDAPYTFTDDGSGWTVTLCISDRDDGKKDYNYTAFNAKGTSSGLKKINWFCPKCCTDEVMVVYEGLSSPSITVEAPGVGSPTGALENFLQGFVVWSPPADDINYKLVTNAIKTTKGTVLLELAGNDVPIPFLVPGCAPAPEVPCEPKVTGVATSSQICANLFGTEGDGDEAHYWYYRKNDATSCPDHEKPFYLCTGLCPEDGGLDLDNCILLPPQLADRHIVASNLEGQRCPDEATKQSFTNSPFYKYETWGAGYYWVGCLDLNYPNTGVPWVNL